jgi:ComF family protein
MPSGSTSAMKAFSASPRDVDLNTTRSSVFYSLLDGVLAVILAPACAACDAILDEPSAGPVCRSCWEAIVPFTAPLCQRCGDPLPSWRVISVAASRCPRCRRRPSQVSVTRAIGSHDGTLRAIVHALKYGKRRSLAKPLAARMRAHAGDVLGSADVVVPVPLHRTRLRSRGFNQAGEIAQHLGVPVRLALRRRRATPSQTDLPAGQRHRNVRGAFALARGADVRGLRVALVDDVCTTGATLEACARVLRDAGAADVGAVTAARVATRRRG